MVHISDHKNLDRDSFSGYLKFILNSANNNFGKISHMYNQHLFNKLEDPSVITYLSPVLKGELVN